MNGEVLFDRTINEIENDLCFVLMPFRSNFDELHSAIIKPTMTEMGMKCKRGDEIYGTKSVMSDIWEYIQRARVVIADLTDQNPNVLYELGICHAINKDVIIITQSMNDVPFDLRHLRCIEYRNTQQGWVKLREELRKTTTSLKCEISLPFEVVLKFGEKGEKKGQFNNSRDIAVDSKNNIFISDGDNYRIQKFSSEGEFITSWGSHGQEKGKFDDPREIAVDKYGNIYVADYLNNRIQIFDEDGQFLRQFILENDMGIIPTPYGIAINKFSEIYITNSNTSHMIMKFNKNGNLVSYWGGYGRGNGEFNNPLGITIDSEENIYIADNNNHRIQKFNPEGEFLLKWGRKNDEPGDFLFPRGVTYKDDKIYVSESGIPRVQIFTKDGKYLGKIKTKPKVPFNRPTGIAFDQKEYLYIVNRGFDQVLKLKMNSVKGD
jgi:DNA-binding beta-propeller fold protein YncE